MVRRHLVAVVLVAHYHVPVRSERSVVLLARPDRRSHRVAVAAAGHKDRAAAAAFGHSNHEERSAAVVVVVHHDLGTRSAGKH